MNHPIVLGIDPGLICTGWCIIRGRAVVDFGSLRCPKSEADPVQWMVSRVNQLLMTHAQLLHSPLVSVERYCDQGPVRRGNPSGYLVAELVGGIVQLCRSFGFSVSTPNRNEALRAVVIGKRGRGAPTEKRANETLRLLGIVLPNQHTRDAAMVALAGGNR